MQQDYSQHLHNQWTNIAAHNEGHTADDLISRYQQGEKSHLDLAEKYQTKASAFNSGADAIDYLRSRLSDIAQDGNKDIDDILASKKPPPEQLAEVQAVQARCNADAANAARDAGDKLMAATQKILDAEGIGGDARSWAQANGFNMNGGSPPSPISEHDLNPAFGGGAHDGPKNTPNTPLTKPASFGSGEHGVGGGGGSNGAGNPGAQAPGVVGAGWRAGVGTAPAPAGPSAPSTSPTYLPDQSAAAHKQLCDAYVLAARAIQIDTDGDNPALAGLATVNGAALLEQVVISAPALPPEDRRQPLRWRLRTAKRRPHPVGCSSVMTLYGDP